MSETSSEKPIAAVPAKKNMHAIILAVIAVIVIIAGYLVATVRGTGLRGSGLGTALLVIGFVALVIALLRFYYRKA